MHTYTFRFYHRQGYLTHRVMRQCADLADALQWSCETMQHDHAMLEILDGETLLWRGTHTQACASTQSAA